MLIVTASTTHLRITSDRSADDKFIVLNLVQPFFGEWLGMQSRISWTSIFSVWIVAVAVVIAVVSFPVTGDGKGGGVKKEPHWQIARGFAPRPNSLANPPANANPGSEALAEKASNAGGAFVLPDVQVGVGRGGSNASTELAKGAKRAGERGSAGAFGSETSIDSSVYPSLLNDSSLDPAQAKREQADRLLQVANSFQLTAPQLPPANATTVGSKPKTETLPSHLSLTQIPPLAQSESLQPMATQSPANDLLATNSHRGKTAPAQELLASNPFANSLSQAQSLSPSASQNSWWQRVAAEIPLESLTEVAQQIVANPVQTLPPGDRMAVSSTASKTAASSLPQSLIGPTNEEPIGTGLYRSQEFSNARVEPIDDPFSDIDASLQPQEIALDVPQQTTGSAGQDRTASANSSDAFAIQSNKSKLKVQTVAAGQKPSIVSKSAASQQGFPQDVSPDRPHTPLTHTPLTLDPLPEADSPLTLDGHGLDLDLAAESMTSQPLAIAGEKPSRDTTVSEPMTVSEPTGSVSQPTASDRLADQDSMAFDIASTELPNEPMLPNEPLLANDSVLVPLAYSLLQHIERTSKEVDSPQIRQWAIGYKMLVRELCLQNEATAARQVLNRLEAKRIEYTKILQGLETDAIAESDLIALRHLSYALDRRLDFWQAIIPGNPIVIADSRARKITAELAKARRWDFRSVKLTREWSEYLLWPQMVEVINGKSFSPADQQLVASEILKRINSGTLTYEQTSVIAKVLPLELQQQLFSRSGLSVDLRDILTAIETFETTGNARSAMQIMEGFRWLRLSDDAADQQMARLITNHYRNANFRFTASREFINRWFVNQDWVNQAIAAQPSTHVGIGVMPVQIDLIPSDDGFHFQLSPAGQEGRSDGWQNAEEALDSDPESNLQPNDRTKESSPEWTDPTSDHPSSRVIAIAYHQSDNSADEAPPIPVGYAPGTVGTAPSAVGAAYAQLPFVDWMLIRNGHLPTDGAPEVKIRGDIKVEGALGQEIGQQLQQRFAETQATLERTIRSFQVAGLTPTVIQNSSSVQEIAARFRIADDTQLASHTARPNPTPNALLSVQIHQSMINNLSERLEISGRSFSWQTFLQHLAGIAGRHDLPSQLDDHDQFTFTERQAIVCEFVNDRVYMTLNFSRASIGGIQSGPCSARIAMLPVVDGVQLGLQTEPRQLVQVQSNDLTPAQQNRIVQTISKRWFGDAVLWVTPNAWNSDFVAKQLHIARLDLTEGWLSVSVERIAAPARSIAKHLNHWPTHRLLSGALEEGDGQVSMQSSFKQDRTTKTAEKIPSSPVERSISDRELIAPATSKSGQASSMGPDTKPLRPVPSSKASSVLKSVLED